jgi:hypothetical protein
MPAGNTYEAIATQTLGSAAASVTFSSIPGTYTDLVIVFNGGITTGPDDMRLEFNANTTGYSATLLRGDGSAAISARATGETAIPWMGYLGTGAAGSVSIINIQNYANTAIFKTALNRGNVAASFVSATVGLWRNTSAITSCKLIAGSSTFLSGSTFSLYGIVSA